MTNPADSGSTIPKYHVIVELKPDEDGRKILMYAGRGDTLKLALNDLATEARDKAAACRSVATAAAIASRRT